MDISVIIPVYNTEKYLPSCIDSILGQSDVSFEIILVDDGSSDSSPNICDDYAKKYNNIKVYHIKNSGPATARNKGFSIAQGEYVTFTDSDDKMAEERNMILTSLLPPGIYKDYKSLSHLDRSTLYKLLNLLDQERGCKYITLAVKIIYRFLRRFPELFK